VEPDEERPERNSEKQAMNSEDQWCTAMMNNNVNYYQKMMHKKRMHKKKERKK
jgi:hypothetical protein